MRPADEALSAHPPIDWWADPDPERALEGYLEMYKTAYGSHNLASVKRLIPRPGNPGARAMDYGCGGGHLTVHLGRLGYQVVACDASPHSLAACRLHAEAHALEPNTTFVQNKPPDFWEGVPGDLDLVVAKDVIEHIEDDRAFLDALTSRLNPGGQLVLVTQNDHSWNFAIEAPRMRARDPSWCGWHPTEHKRFYNRGRLKALLEDAGLRPNAWRAVYLVPYQAFMGPVPRKIRNAIDKLLGEAAFYWPERLLGGVWPFNGWGWSIHVRARKDHA